MMPHYEPLEYDERETVEKQLGRRLRGKVMVAARCPHGVVEVLATSPLLDGETPFPTLFWLTCPLLQRAVSGLESGDFREVLRRKARDVPGFAEALRQAEMDYVHEREQWAGETGENERVRKIFEDRRGIGGTVAGGMKCFHAHLAHYRAGGRNPVGAELHEKIQGLQEKNCEGDCGPFLRGKERR